MRLAAALLLSAAAAALSAAACQQHEFEPPSQEERVERADSLYSLYSPALFDTVTWANDSIRFLEGNLVYSSECRDCHGPLGEAGTDYARERNLAVPSLVEPDWEYGGDVEALRRQIFIGHPEGMPSWGVARVTPREIDAVAHYILEGLRGDGAGTPGGG